MDSLKKYARKLYIPLIRKTYEVSAVILPVYYAKRKFKRLYGKSLNIKRPQDLLEKNFWLRVNSDLTLWTKCADKHQVRDYVKNVGLEHILIKQLGVWRKAEEIDFECLPEKFVLKTNHSCGKNIIVHNKNQLNEKKVKLQLNQWISERYGLSSFEPHYWNIPRRIIAEEFLEGDEAGFKSSSLIDYKFFCINGEPEIIKVMYDREKGRGYKTVTVDSSWIIRTDLVPTSVRKRNKLTLPKPKSLNEMINVSRILSKPFPFVRVDLYEVNGKVYFGELTFTPGGKNNFTEEYLLKLGKKMDLTKAKPRTKKFII